MSVGLIGAASTRITTSSAFGDVTGTSSNFNFNSPSDVINDRNSNVVRLIVFL
ncbi:exported hypothetical protein [Cupriavidus taiwanensis]|nr:exported hypothetical protein [Cupriavidus taiwanensis]SPA34467.1 exported hypothetical protein [Cupriavidus taiwanensis]